MGQSAIGLFRGLAGQFMKQKQNMALFENGAPQRPSEPLMFVWRPLARGSIHFEKYGLVRLVAAVIRC